MSDITGSSSDHGRKREFISRRKFWMICFTSMTFPLECADGHGEADLVCAACFELRAGGNSCQ